MPRLDPHSYADQDQPQTGSLSLALRVDFETRTLSAETVLHFREPRGGPLDLDTRDLRIESVTALDGTPLPYSLAAPEPILGARLRVEVPTGSLGVRLRSTTS